MWRRCLFLLSVSSTGLAADIYEPDNSRLAAANIAAGVLQRHDISPAGDVDWMRFAPPSIRKYVFYIYADKLDLRPEIWIKQGLLPEILLTKPFVVKRGCWATTTFNPSVGTAYFKIGVRGASQSLTGSYRVEIFNQ